MAKRLPKIPSLLERKIYKTGQTRGADDDVIYQNRVSRNSTVLIPYDGWSEHFNFPDKNGFENGYIVLISPADYFENNNIENELKAKKLKLGDNLLIFYYTRKEWEVFNPGTKGLIPATNRMAPLGGQYVARVPASTATKNGDKIRHGFTSTSMKGAGIRVFEYASLDTIKKTRIQLEALFWLCKDSENAALDNKMTKEDIEVRKEAIFEEAKLQELLDFEKLIAARIINNDHNTVCPLCLEELSAIGFLSRMQQAEGRTVQDLTVTEVNLFHIKELRVGIYNHKPYNLGWGHHHCNVVTKDAGIEETLNWMKTMLKKNQMI